VVVWWLVQAAPFASIGAGIRSWAHELNRFDVAQRDDLLDISAEEKIRPVMTVKPNCAMAAPIFLAIS